MKVLPIILLICLSACSSSSGYVQLPSGGSRTEVTTTPVTINLLDLSADVSVTAVTKNFFPDAAVLENPADKGMQFLLVSVKVVNKSNDVFPCNPAAFSLKNADQVYRQTELLSKSEKLKLLTSQEVAINSACEGELAFVLPQDINLQETKLLFAGFERAEKSYEIPLQ